MKKFTVIMAFAGLAIVWAQGAGPGQGRGGMQNRPTFASYDLNGDGKITQDEFNTARAERMKKRAAEGRQLRNAGNAPTFESLDTNGDNVLTPDEFRAHRAQRRGQGRGPGKGRGMGMNP